jgi:hypothetical protein
MADANDVLTQIGEDENSKVMALALNEKVINALLN